MRRAAGWLLSLAAAAFIILAPWPANWQFRSSETILRPLPPRPPAKAGHLPYEACTKAIQFLRENRRQFQNRRFITVIDYTKPSTSRRLFLINLKTGEVQRFLVSHGKNSGWLYATRFSNREGSFQSPLGFFRTGSKYIGSHGPCLELQGLQKGVNDNARSRGIVMHGARYACSKAIAANHAYGSARLGRSLGCPTVPMEAAEDVIDKIKGGSLLYIHAK
ncbi:MAG: murein L,D-transpeptidase catalytic domain family protein [Syntrophobacteraceae bacterium]|jgi:hypothetical protein